MINFQLENGKFNYRIAGILQRDNRILFHKEQSEDFWTLPGGRAELLEDSKATLVREFKEELNCEVEVARLKYVAENFFEYKGIDYHEVGMIYLVELKEGNIQDGEFTVVEDGVTYFFKWFKREELEGKKIYPTFLSGALNEFLTPDIQHFIEK